MARDTKSRSGRIADESGGWLGNFLADEAEPTRVLKRA